MRAPSLRTAAAVLPFLALASCGGPVLFAELEMPSVQVTLPQYEFQPLPFIGGSSTEFSFDLGANVPVVNEPNVEFDLKLTRMTLVLQTGGLFSSFDDVDTITIRALPPAGSALPPITLIAWQNPHTTMGLTSITATSDSDADLRGYLSAGALTVEASYAGTGAPTDVWTADVSAEFWMKVTLDYGAYL